MMVERPAGIEPVVLCLEGSSSTIELRTRNVRQPMAERFFPRPARRRFRAASFLGRLVITSIVYASLAACATRAPEPVIIPQPVSMEVTRPCVAKPIPRPEFIAPTLAALLALPDAAARYQALLSDVGLRIEYERGLENVVAACGVK